MTPQPQNSFAGLQTATPAQQPEPIAQPQGRRKGRALLSVWLTIFLLCVVVVATVGVVAYQKYANNQPSQQASSFVPVQGPSGATSVQRAAATILNPQTASHIDVNYNPVYPGKSFGARQKIYISFNIQTRTQKGYIEVKWYSGKQLKDTDTFSHDPGNTSGYFSTIYDKPTQGTAELYWCTQASCGDAQLAQVVTFTVTP
ncbi:hypothetical protein KDK_15590 [Dictyobacter kobayashii]|uniref:Uncharacterized protein n=2 Tax=Dictyobacter kobayashii TaxID=2014872 RepID=A0A402AF83_9CHLR|nr:hypothetical protein KDK_15590 [Dictyobacter kobayashii]